ncbi:glycosyltransferase [Hyphomicrobium sp.]|uniref:glycosyltransferase family 2 protein n=1 Tax=Hyphomicrobium sp. TaxID=82 RepID=UPI000FB2C09E|nr:glycosyltransferase [Hyphomicrobium sp.]RUP10664.1 MAG: glycosyltransferase family 2 protein [Hyphomicrobium sp.]
MPEQVSVCIPTYERPKLLQAAIHSCLAQTYRPLHIVVGDNSRSPETAEVLRGLPVPEGVTFDYLPPPEIASQRENVIRLFNHVTTRYVSLLHDDDLFPPGGLDATIQAAYDHPASVGAFGVQEVIDAAGTVLSAETAHFNQTYLRTGEYLDRIQSLWFSALSLQLPSDGYVLKTSLAKQAATTMPPSPGSAVDVAFALRLAEVSGDASIFASSVTTHRYRLTPGAETERLDHLPIFTILQQMTVPDAYKDLQKQRLAIFLIAAINERLSRGDVKTARELILSQEYPASQRWRPMGIFHTAAAHLRLPPSVVRVPYVISGNRRFAHRSSAKA